ncbi:cation diffusion facilitator family transporter [Calidifontibacillus oryziterrae]|uniref:cation diffusion facilitator family transporter n=1 Tax=Calidifontibacillus oryziterrae TaxID=1191699 RepID=UPI0002F349C8|nr:cation diffusion facilitator family transporter [Calidifontibacillus oryziterrae]
METINTIRKGEIGAWISIFAYIFLAVIKLIIGNISGSEALSADGLNNSTDIIASVAVLIGLKISRKPPDQNHQYGHLRSETVASLLASFIMMAVGIQVLYNALLSVIHVKQESPDMLAAWTALFSFFVMFAVYKYNFKLAKKINSHAVMAAAQDNKSDSYVSLGAFIGIIGSQFGYAWVDTITALIVGVLICKTAWDIFRQASLSLTDAFESEELQEIERIVIDTPGVLSLNDIKGRYHGSSAMIDIIIEVNPNITILAGHKIADLIEERLKMNLGIHYVHIHVEPSMKNLMSNESTHKK